MICPSAPRLLNTGAIPLLLFGSALALETSAASLTPVPGSPYTTAYLNFELEDENPFSQTVYADPTAQTWAVEWPSPADSLQGFTNAEGIGFSGYIDDGLLNGSQRAFYRMDFELDEDTLLRFSGNAMDCAPLLAICGGYIELESIDDQGQVLTVVRSIDADQDLNFSEDFFVEQGFYRLRSVFAVSTDDIGVRTFSAELEILGPCGEPLCPACDDGVDNDGDGQIDHPADIGCESPDSDIEDPQCDDHLDNDGDGRCDGSLSTCSDGSAPGDQDCFLTPFRDSELPVCSDGFDNDGDGLVDLADPHCASADQRSETWVGCGLGWELTLLLPIITLVRDGRRRAAMRDLRASV